MKILRYWRPDDLPASLPHTEGDGPRVTEIKEQFWPDFNRFLGIIKSNPAYRYTLHEQTETLIEERR